MVEMLLPKLKKLESFLYSVAHNKAIDFFRAAKRSPVLQEALWEAITEIAETLNISANTVGNHLAASIEFIREPLRKHNALILLPASFFEKFL